MNSNGDRELSKILNLDTGKSSAYLAGLERMGSIGNTIEALGGLVADQGLLDKEDGGHVFARASSTVLVPVTAGANTDGTITQPAGTIIKDIVIIPQATITTAGNSGDDVDFSMGTTAGGVEILAAKALLDDGGAAVTTPAGVPLAVVSDYTAAGAQAFVLRGGPATNEAFVITNTPGILYSSAQRTLNFRITPLQTNLAASGNIKVVVNFIRAQV